SSPGSSSSPGWSSGSRSSPVAGATSPERHSTMRATIAWSYDLLSEPEQRLFTRLAVFVGSFELQAAEQICDADLDAMRSLNDKSLVRHGENGRLFLLGTTREYAVEQFDSSDERDE